MSKNTVNTASSNKCKRCKNPVQTGLKCVVCGVISHKSCLNALKTVKFLDDSTVNCCNGSSDITTIRDQSVRSPDPVGAHFSTEDIKIKYLEELIRQRDIIIETQSVAIKSLQEQVSYLKNELEKQSSFVKRVADTERTRPPQSCSSKVANKDTSSGSNGGNNFNVAPSYVTAAAVSHAVEMAQTSVTSQNVIHLNDDLQNIGENSNSVPQRGPRFKNPRKSRTILVGDAECLSDDSILKAAKAVALKHFHTTNWDPDTNDESLTKYLSELVPDVQVEKLNSRNPRIYASFKVTVPSSEVHKITKPEVWPSGVRVNQFFRSRQYNKSQPKEVIQDFS